MLAPKLQDQEAAYRSQFAGMTTIPFSYDDYVATRLKLVQAIPAWLTERDRQFLVSFKEGNPDWGLIPLPALKELPAVQWKLQNIQSFKKKNTEKHAQQLERLKKVLFQL